MYYVELCDSFREEGWDCIERLGPFDSEMAADPAAKRAEDLLISDRFFVRVVEE